MTRNVTGTSQWIAPMAPADVLPRLLRMRERYPQLAPDVSRSDRRLTIAADAFEAHGVDLARVLSGGRTGLAWTAIAATDALPGSAMPTDFGRVQPSLLQVTNLGLTVKDSPQSTLVFVTRLDTAQPVAGARVTIRTPANSALWTGTTDGEGMAMAPALALRSPRDYSQLSYVVTAEKDGDVAWVGSDWTGDVHPFSFGMRYGLDEASDVLRGSVFTDRGVYTRGEDVRGKAVLRSDRPEGMGLVSEGTRILLTCSRQPRRRSRSPDAAAQSVEQPRLDRAFAGGTRRWETTPWRRPWTPACALAPNGPRPAGAYGSFMVAAFRRPDFRVDATLTTAIPILGATHRRRLPKRSTCSARQLARSRSAGSPIDRRSRVCRTGSSRSSQTAAVSRSAIARRPLRPRRLFQEVAQKTETLDAQGRLKTELPTEAGDDYASLFRFEADVTGAANQHIANRAASRGASGVVLRGPRPAGVFCGREERVDDVGGRR